MMNVFVDEATLSRCVVRAWLTSFGMHWHSVRRQAHLPTARLRSQSQKAGESPGEGPVPTCPMSLEAAAIFLRALGGTGHIGMASEVLAKQNPVILASATQLTEAARKLHPAIQPVRSMLVRGWGCVGDAAGIINSLGKTRACIDGKI